MRLSRVIEKLQVLKHENGDIELFGSDGTDPYFEVQPDADYEDKLVVIVE